MDMNKLSSSLLLFGIISFSLIPNVSAQTSDMVKERTPADIIIDTELQINLVLIGDSWSTETKTQIMNKLLHSYTPMVFAEDRPVGVRYNYTYNFESAPEDVSTELFKFIDSIGVKTSAPLPIEQWFFAQHPEIENENIVYKLIDAFRVEEWLADLERDKGYTIYFLKPSEQELGYTHTYGAVTKDPDTNREFVQEGMMGFGGKYRFYFIDLTAGPWLYPFIGISETQAISQFHMNIYDLESDEAYYKFIADYVNNAIMLLFTPSYLYSPIYKLNYKMEVFLVDMTSGRVFRDIAENYIDSKLIEQTFAKLIPYAQWTSDITGKSFDTLPRELQRAILRSLSFQHTVGGDTVLVKSSEFITELRKWIETTLTEEELRLEQEEAERTVFVPIVLFVFDANAFVDKVPVVGAAIPDPADKTSPCCAIVAANKHALLDYGAGLSTLAIHEMGHVIGLRHPHDGYSQSEGEFNNWFFDWSYSPMTYASPGTLGCGLPAEVCGLIVNEFGVFNLDAVDRGLVLSLLDQVQLDLYDSVSQLQAKGYDKNNLPQDIRSKLSSIDNDLQRSKELFGEMNYFNFTSFTNTELGVMDDAFDFALNAFTSSQLLLEESRNLKEMVPKPVVYGVNILNISEPSFVDENGTESNVLKVLKPIVVKPSIASEIEQKVNFTAILQVKDDAGFTVSLTSIDLNISPGEKLEPSISLLLEKPGEFNIEIFLWTGSDHPVPLSQVKKASFLLVE